MNFKFCYFLIVIAVTGCAGVKTPYGPLTKDGGYSVQPFESDVLISNFSGNSFLTKDEANIYAQFRAHEYCFEKNFTITNIHDVKETSTSQTVQKSFSNTIKQPTVIQGSASTNTNVYGDSQGIYGKSTTNVNGTISGGNQTTNNTTWNETQVFPGFEVYFRCSKNSFITGLKLKNLSGEEMKDFVKDLMGGVQVEDIPTESINFQLIQVGDIIYKVEGSRISNRPQFVKAVSSAPKKDKINVSIFRDGKSLNIFIKASENTENRKETNTNFIRSACKISGLSKQKICSSL